MMVFFARAQSILLFYQTPEQFNSSAYNPAFLTSQHQFTFSMFPLSGMSAGYNNQDIVRKMHLEVVRGDSLNNTLTNVFNKLVRRGIFYQRFESSLLNFGYNSNFGSFNFQIKEVEQIMSNLNGSVSDFLTNPSFNTIAVNQAQLFPVNALYYREYSLGFAREIIPNRLSIGIRAKLYFGKYTVYSEVQGVMNSDYYLKTYGPMKLSFPLNLVESEDSIPTGGNAPANFSVGNFLMNSKNMGAGIDLGIKYSINSQFILSASVIDLGRINWRNNLNTLNFKGSYKFPTEFIKDSMPEYLTKNPNFATDTLHIPDLFKASIGNDKFSTNLPAIFYVGAQYQLNPNFNIGLVDRFISSKGMSFNSISISGTYMVNKSWTISSGYSIIGNSFYNIPIGIIHNWAGGQFFMAADNLLSFFLPSIPEYSGITFGTCFYLFKEKVKYDDSEYLPFYKVKREKPIRKNGLQFKNNSDY